MRRPRHRAWRSAVPHPATQMVSRIASAVAGHSSAAGHSSTWRSAVPHRATHASPLPTQGSPRKAGDPVPVSPSPGRRPARWPRPADAPDEVQPSAAPQRARFPGFCGQRARLSQRPNVCRSFGLVNGARPPGRRGGPEARDPSLPAHPARSACSLNHPLREQPPVTRLPPKLGGRGGPSPRC